MATVPPSSAPDPIQIACTGPGPPHTFSWIPRGGKRPKFCPEHRRSQATDRSQVAHEARRQDITEDIRSASLAREVGQLSRLAASLRIYSDPAIAAKFVGISAEGPELEALVNRARAEHPTLIEGGMRETARLAETLIHVLLVEVMERRAEMPARDLANFFRSALQARNELIGDGPQTNYLAISLGVVPPPLDGKLTAEQEARVKGTPMPEPDASPE